MEEVGPLAITAATKIVAEHVIKSGVLAFESDFNNTGDTKHPYLSALLLNEACGLGIEAPVGMECIIRPRKGTNLEVYVSFGTHLGEEKADSLSDKDDDEVYFYTMGIAGLIRLLNGEEDDTVIKIKDIIL